jgi:two-component system response regulator
MDSAEILLIEDNRHDVEMILDALGDQCDEKDVCVLRDGAEALNYIFEARTGILGTNGTALPRLIILDLKLPKVSGTEILKRIKSDERTKHIPVVVFTSSNEIRDRMECYKLGVNSYIVKPLDADQFSMFVKDMGAYWMSMNETLYD